MYRSRIPCSSGLRAAWDPKRTRRRPLLAVSPPAVSTTGTAFRPFTVSSLSPLLLDSTHSNCLPWSQRLISSGLLLRSPFQVSRCFFATIQRETVVVGPASVVAVLAKESNSNISGVASNRKRRNKTKHQAALQETAFVGPASVVAVAKESSSTISGVASDGNSPSNAKRRAALRQRREKLRERRRIQSAQKKMSEQELIWGQWSPRSKEELEDLFDMIASNYSLPKLLLTVDKLKREVDDKGKKQPDLITARLADLLRSTGPVSGAQVAVLEALVLSTASTELTDAASQKSERNSSKNTADDTSTSLEEVLPQIDVLMAARECALENEAFWPVVGAKEAPKMGKKDRQKILAGRRETHSSKTEIQLRQEAADLVDFLFQVLPPRVFRLVLGIFKVYANVESVGHEKNDNQHHPLDSGDVSSDKRLLGQGESDLESDTSKQDKKGKKRKKKRSTMTVVRAKLYNQASTYYHLIVERIVEFFYLNQGLDHSLVELDERVVDAKSKWEANKAKFVEVLMKVQDQIVECLEHHHPDQHNESERILKSATQEIERKLNPHRPPILTSREVDRRFRKAAHLTFEAMQLQESILEWPLVRNDDSSTMTQTTVFLDSLPIDISKDEIVQLYSRCGAIGSVEIFNQRPELDPGPLSRSEQIARQKKKQKTLKGQRWHRPKTPVYALVTFCDESGYRRASEDSLRIFGMIIRRHPVRTIRATDMSRLYLENLPAGIQCVDLEYQLSQQLHPDLFCCLDAGQNNHASVESCEIKFPSFELALESYGKLQGLEELLLTQFPDSGDETTPEQQGKFAVNWMRTPKDAIQWWTRTLSFD